MANRQTKILVSGIFIILIIVVAASYLALTGFAVENQTNIIAGQTEEVEVWASSHVEIEVKENQIETNVFMDNGTYLDEEVEIYLDDQILSKNKSLFNLSETSPGNYSIKILFQGSPSQFIEKSLYEKDINIDENGNLGLIENPASKNVENNILENETQSINQINQIKPNNCETFEEDVLWSSGYSNKENSLNYEFWRPNSTCQDCFITNIELKTRFLSSANGSQQKEGYVQISNSNQKNLCENSEQGTYEKYLAYETIQGEAKKVGFYKQGNQTLGFTPLDCYGIKLYSDQNFIVDVFGIKYDLCKNE